MSHLPDLVLVVDDDLRVRGRSASVERLLGPVAELLDGEGVLALVDPGDRPRAEAFLRRAAESQGTEGPVMWRSSDGSRLLEVLAVNARHDPAVGGVILVARTGGLAHLVAHLAHEINNALAVVLSAGRELEGARLPAGTRADVDRIVQAAEHGMSVSRQALQVGRGEPVPPMPVMLPDVVEEALRLLERSIPSGITVQHRFGRRVEVAMDRTQLLEVVLNLIRNAFDAMGAGGELRVTTDGTHAWGLLRVTDTGEGMEPEVLSRALDPLFTTKPGGRGTGLGLAIAAGIVHKAGGRLTLQSRRGRGTLAEVVLPAISAQVGRVLLVEDDAGVRDLTKRLLVEEGFEVLEAGDGNEALRVHRNHGPFDVLVTDHAMPGCTGVELAERLCASESRPGVVLMSGSIAPPPDGAIHLQKPFARPELIGAVRNALASRER